MIPYEDNVLGGNNTLGEIPYVVGEIPYVIFYFKIIFFFIFKKLFLKLAHQNNLKISKTY